MRHYQIHAGLYLAAKEFRYIITLKNKASIRYVFIILALTWTIKLKAFSTDQTIYVF